MFKLYSIVRLEVLKRGGMPQEKKARETLSLFDSVLKGRCLSSFLTVDAF
jgi:hypothetical protein